MYPCRPKVEAFDNVVDVVERLHDPTDPSTEHTAPPSSAHVQLDDDPRAPIQQSFGDEFRQHDALSQWCILRENTYTLKF